MIVNGQLVLDKGNQPGPGPAGPCGAVDNAGRPSEGSFFSGGGMSRRADGQDAPMAQPRSSRLIRVRI